MNVGDYVKYKYENGIYIGKIKFISEVMSGLDETLQLDIDNCMEEILKLDVIKSSPNIIDLIEVGDYVNGYLVIEKDINNELRYIDLKDRNMKYVKYLDVKSIVTKEQFESMEYKVKE